MDDELLSWEAAYKQRENEAILACARSVDRLNATLCRSAWEWGFTPDNLRLFPTVPGRAIRGPVEMTMLRHLGLIADDPPDIRPFPPIKATD